MIGLLFFGLMLEKKIGSKRFLALYLISGILVSVIASFIYPVALGASGALMAVIGALVILCPKIKIVSLMLPIPIPLWIWGIIWVLGDMLGIFFQPGVANVAHIVGFALGAAYAYWMIKKYGKKSQETPYTTHMSEKDLEDYMNTGRI
jgi:membrane associated rhomboid family serine protease